MLCKWARFNAPVVAFAVMVALAIVTTGCGGNDFPPPADPTGDFVEVSLLFFVDVGDPPPDHDDPCVWFDGYRNHATTVAVTLIGAVGQDIHPVQVFRNGIDFSGGNPNGIRIEVPKAGNYSMVVEVYGETDEDCCPGSPPGKPVFKAVWNYFSTDNQPVFKCVPKFSYCIY